LTPPAESVDWIEGNARRVEVAVRRSLPNVLTALRLAAAPAIAVILSLSPGPLGGWLAFTLFVAAAATDWLDGKLARAWNAQSAFGRMLDPIADKAMTLTALVVVVGLYGTEGLRAALALPAAAIILRETLVAGLREHLGGGPTLAVTGAAKWKTATQLIALSLLLLAAPLADRVGPLRVLGLSLGRRAALGRGGFDGLDRMGLFLEGARRDAGA
jgi:cardiolipin synthase